MQLNVITPAAATLTATLLLAAVGPDDSVQLRFAPRRRHDHDPRHRD